MYWSFVNSIYIKGKVYDSKLCEVNIFYSYPYVVDFERKRCDILALLIL